MNSSPLVAERHGDRSVFAQVEVVVVVVVVRSYPSNPHASRVLTGKDPHRVVVLGKLKTGRWMRLPPKGDVAAL